MKIEPKEKTIQVGYRLTSTSITSLGKIADVTGYSANALVQMAIDQLIEDNKEYLDMSSMEEE
jgi:hypothetical protein